MVEEVDAVVPAHVVVGDFVCIGNVLLLENLHLALLLRRVDPVWLVPFLGLDLLKIDLGGGHLSDSVDEVVLEVAVVEDHVRVVELGVELLLDLSHCVENAPQVLVSGHDHERGVGQLVCGRVDGPDKVVDLGLRDDLLQDRHQLVVVVFDDLFPRSVLVVFEVEAFQSVGVDGGCVDRGVFPAEVVVWCCFCVGLRVQLSHCRRHRHRCLGDDGGRVYHRDGAAAAGPAEHVETSEGQQCEDGVPGDSPEDEHGCLWGVSRGGRKRRRKRC